MIHKGDFSIKILIIWLLAVSYGCNWRDSTKGSGSITQATSDQSPDSLTQQEKKQTLDPLPWHFINIWWNFQEEAHFQRLDIDVTVMDVSREYNFYISPINTSINGCTLYAGIQTNTLGHRSKSDNTRVNLGKGGIFSRWSKDRKTPIGLDYIEMFEDGACESAGYEGEFCSVRRPFDWTTGTYTFSLIKENTVLHKDVQHTWVAYEITHKETNETKRIGRLLFEGESLILRTGFAAFVEIYGTAPKIPSTTVTFGFPKINGIELPVSNVYAFRPYITPNVTKVSLQGRDMTVILDPDNPQPGPMSKERHYFIME